MLETWKTIDGYPNYVISNCGRIRRKSTSRELLGWRMKGGYRSTVLGGKKRLYFHRLVVENFICPIPKGMDVNHKDGNKENNSADNLEIVTRLENNLHAWRTGLQRIGSEHGQSKLTEENVRELRSLYREGKISIRQACKKYGISSTGAIHSVIHGRTWRHVQ